MRLGREGICNMKEPAAKIVVNPEEREAAAGLIRAMSMIYNLCLSYGFEHPVVVRSTQEHIARFSEFLGKHGEFTVFFIHGRAWWEAVSMEDGNLMVSRLAQCFSEKRVSGLTLTAGVTGEDLRRLFNCLGRDGGSRIFDIGLQAMLEEAGAKNIRERKEKIVIVGQAPKLIPISKSPRDEGISATGTDSPVQIAAPDGGGESDKPEEAAKNAAGGVGRRTPAGGNRPQKSWDLELEEAGGGHEPEPEVVEPPETTFRNIARMAADSVLMRRISPAAAAEMMAREFEMRRSGAEAEAERSARLLMKIRDALLGEMESRGTAVILADTQLNVLAMNPAGRKILGTSAVVEVGSPLHDFVCGGKPEETIVFSDGRPWLARQQTHSVEGMEGGLTLIVLDSAAAD